MDVTPTDELSTILDQIAYEMTTARTAGFGNTARLREALRRARTLVDDADSLVASFEITRQAAKQD